MPKLNTDKEFLWLVVQNSLVKQLNHETTFLSSACEHHREITQSYTFAALIMITLSTTTQNLLTFNTRKISSNNSEKLGLYGRQTPLDFSLTLVLFKFSDVKSYIYGQQKGTVLARVKLHLQFCFCLVELMPRTLFQSGQRNFCYFLTN